MMMTYFENISQLLLFTLLNSYSPLQLLTLKFVHDRRVKHLRRAEIVPPRMVLEFLIEESRSLNTNFLFQML